MVGQLRLKGNIGTAVAFGRVVGELLILRSSDGMAIEQKAKCRFRG